MVTSMLGKQIGKPLALNFKRMLNGCVLLQMCLIKYIKTELVAIVKQDRVNLISALKKGSWRFSKTFALVLLFESQHDM